MEPLSDNVFPSHLAVFVGNHQAVGKLLAYGFAKPQQDVMALGKP